MAIYRNISMSFWTDTKIVDDFSPEDKYFMLYCLTNQYTNLCGCYEISIKQMTRDTGYNEETIIKLLDRLNNRYKVIQYNKINKELYIVNWFKYNWTKSEKLDKPLLKEIKNIKTPEFKEKLSKLYNNRDTVSIPYIYTMDTTVSVSDTVSDTVSVSDNNIYKEIIDYLNFKTNKHFKYTKNNINKIKIRFKDGFTKEDFKNVIDKKCHEWLKDDKMNVYLRPETLFGSKFESYLNQPIRKKNIKDISLKELEEIENETNRVYNDD